MPELAKASESESLSGFDAVIAKHAPEHLREELLDICRNGRQEAEEVRAERERQQRLKTMRDYRLTKLSETNLKGAMWNDTLKSFRAGSPSQNQAKAAIQRWLAKFPGVEQGIALWGDLGVGKSHLLRAIVQALFSPKIDGIYTVKYAYVPDLVRYLNIKGEEVTPLDALYECDVACLDDLSKLDAGTYREHDLARAIGRLFDQAERTGKPIICLTSNEPREWYAEPFDGPFSDRLKICEWIEIRGESWR